jgi:hypothetical protein
MRVNLDCRQLVANLCISTSSFAKIIGLEDRRYEVICPTLERLAALDNSVQRGRYLCQSHTLCRLSGFAQASEITA